MAMKQYWYRWTRGCWLQWHIRTNWAATLILVGWVAVWVSLFCWIGVHFLMTIILIVVALWPIVLLLVVVVLLLGLAIHPKSLVDFAHWLIYLPSRLLRFLWDGPRTESVSFNRDWLSHGFLWPSFSLFHENVRHAWAYRRGPGFSRANLIERSDITGITLESNDSYPIVQVHHQHGIEEIGFDLPADEQFMLRELLQSWLADGTLPEFRATPLTHRV
jgi:hypothetical protein